MQLKWEKVVSALAVLTAIAYSLGWLKQYHFVHSFGLGLASMEFTLQDYLFESWYVVENVLFFLLLFWVVLFIWELGPCTWGLGAQTWSGKTATWTWRLLTTLVGVFYASVPLATHHAFNHLKSSTCAVWLIGHYYTVLKYTPFGILIVVVIFNREFRARVNGVIPTSRKSYLIVYLLVTLGWAISLAKHIGSIDANKVLLSSGKELSRVKFHIADSNFELKPLQFEGNLYLLYVSPSRYFVWDTTGFSSCRLGQPQQAKVLIIPRDKVEWVETWSEVQVQPGPILF